MEMPSAKSWYAAKRSPVPQGLRWVALAHPGDGVDGGAAAWAHFAPLAQPISAGPAHANVQPALLLVAGCASRGDQRWTAVQRNKEAWVCATGLKAELSSSMAPHVVPCSRAPSSRFAPQDRQVPAP